MAGAYIQHFEGPPGAERKVRTEFLDGRTAYYQGYPGQSQREKLVRTESPDGLVYHYCDLNWWASKRDRMFSWLIRAELPSGNVLHFDKRGRQLTQRDFASGLRQYFQGAQWMERAVHIKDANGDILLCYDGYFYLWRLEFLRPVVHPGAEGSWRIPGYGQSRPGRAFLISR